MNKEPKLYKVFETVSRWCYALQEIFKTYPKGSTIPSFKRKIRKKGYKVFKYVEPDYFCQLHPEKTRDIVKEYYYKANDKEKDFYLTCLYSSKNSDLFYFFLEEFEKYYDLYIPYQYICELLQDCIYETRNIKWKDEYVRFLKEHFLCDESKYFYLICGDYQIEEALPYIKDAIKFQYFTSDVAQIALKKYQGNKEKEENTFILTNKTNEMIESGKIEFKKNREKSTILKFIKELKISKEQVIEYCQDNSLETKTVILKYYNQSALVSDKCFYVKCLMSKENTDLFPFLLNELNIFLSLKRDSRSICNSLNNAFFYSRNIKYKEEYIKLVLNETITFKYLIIKLCGKLQISEIVPYLLEELKDEKSSPINCIALEALSYYKNKKDYREVFARYSNSKYLYAKEIAKKVLRSIDKKEN